MTTEPQGRPVLYGCLSVAKDRLIAASLRGLSSLWYALRGEEEGSNCEYNDSREREWVSRQYVHHSKSFPSVHCQKPSLPRRSAVHRPKHNCRKETARCCYTQWLFDCYLLQIPKGHDRNSTGLANIKSNICCSRLLRKIRMNVKLYR